MHKFVWKLDTNCMKSRSEYLFGLKEEEYINLPYLEALKIQRDAGNRLYCKLYKEGVEFERVSMIRIHLVEIESLIKLAEGD